MPQGPDVAQCGADVGCTLDYSHRGGHRGQQACSGGSGPVPHSECCSAGLRRRRRWLPVQRVHSRPTGSTCARAPAQHAACAQRWTRPVGANRTREHVNCSCQVRKSARGLAHICAGTVPPLRRDSPTSVPGSVYAARARTRKRMSAPYQLGGCSRSALLRCSDSTSSTTRKFWAFSTPRTRRCFRPFCRCARATPQACGVARVVQQCNPQRETCQHSARPARGAAPVACATRRCSAYYCSVARRWHRT